MIYKEFEEKSRNVPFGEKGSKDRLAYRERQQAVNMEFRKALEDDYGTSGNPKADKLWDIAWAEGHANGYSEVEMHYETLYELIL